MVLNGAMIHSFTRYVFGLNFTPSGKNLLIGNHYFPPDVSPHTILNYFSFLENKLDAKNH